MAVEEYARLKLPAEQLLQPRLCIPKRKGLLYSRLLVPITKTRQDTSLIFPVNASSSPRPPFHRASARPPAVRTDASIEKKAPCFLANGDTISRKHAFPPLSEYSVEPELLFLMKSCYAYLIVVLTIYTIVNV